MVDCKDVDRAYLGMKVDCPIVLGDNTMNFKLAPFKGDMLGRIMPLMESYNSALKQANGNLEKANEFLDVKQVMEFRDILIEWLLTDLDGSEDDCDDAACRILNTPDGLEQTLNHFKLVHGFDKMTDKEHLKLEVADMQSSSRMVTKNARRAKKNRNRTSSKP